MTKQRMVRSIHGARNAAGMDEDTFRDWLERETGERHLSALDGGRQQAVLRKLQKQAGPSGGRRLSGPYAGKLQALWLSGWNLGIVRDPSDHALLKFLERQTGLQRTEFLRADTDALAVVEPLKAWLAREGGVDWHIVTSKVRSVPAYINNPLFRVGRAQIRKLQALGELPGGIIIEELLLAECGTRSFEDVSRKRWIEVQQQLGARIRELGK